MNAPSARRQRGIHLLAAVTLSSALALVLAGRAGAAVSCQHDQFAQVMTVTLGAASDQVVLDVTNGGEIWWNDGTTHARCGMGSVDNTNAISISGSADGQKAILDLSSSISDDPFSPGASSEQSGDSEIEFAVALTGPGSSLQLLATSRADAVGIRAGSDGVNLNGDDDADITGLGSLPLEVIGGSGGDSISGAGGLGTGTSYPGPMRIRGNAGDDTLTGGAGQDLFYASLATGAADGADVYSGGGGQDTISYAERTNGVSITTADGVANDGEPGEGDLVRADFQIVKGGAGDDTVTTSAGFNELVGGAGDDVLSGGDGTDWLFGGDGDDTLYGGPGDDWFWEDDHANGADSMTGGAGTDDVRYSERSNGVSVTLADGLANDGESGEADLVRGDVEQIEGGSGDDVLVGSSASNTITGGAGNDTIYGSGGADYIHGGDGDDSVYGGPGNDILDSEPWIDGADIVSGGAGSDSLHYSGRSGALTVTTADGLANDGEAGEGDLVRADVEGVEGGSGNDSLTGAPGDDRLYGRYGNDTLAGGDGNDVLEGDQGNDVLYGGPGNDSFDEGSSASGADTMNGGGGIDIVSYHDRSLPVTVTLADGLANDGEAGEGDLVRSDVENLYGGSGNDTITGSSVANTLDGGGGNDTIYAGAGNDSLTGGAGQDHLYGSDGDDFFYAQDGEADVLNGGNGNDEAANFDAGLDTLVAIEVT